MHGSEVALTQGTEPSGTALSAVIITKNAEAQLDACLSSLAFTDEILVLDSGSSDATQAIARKHGARFLHQDWLGFGAQKQAAVDLADNDWVLCIDADEMLSDELAASIKSVLLNPKHQAYSFARCNRFMGRWLRHGEGYPDINLRMFNRRHARWSDDKVHEKVITSVEVKRLAGDLMHESETTLEDYLAKQNLYTTLQAEMLYKRGGQVSLFKLIFSPLFRFVKFYLFRLGFMDGLPGFVHISVGCFNTFTKYVKLLNLKQSKSQA